MGSEDLGLEVSSVCYQPFDLGQVSFLAASVLSRKNRDLLLDPLIDLGAGSWADARVLGRGLPGRQGLGRAVSGWGCGTDGRLRVTVGSPWQPRRLRTIQGPRSFDSAVTPTPHPRSGRVSTWCLPRKGWLQERD